MAPTLPDRYEKALRLLPERLFGLMKNRTVEPHWTGDGDAFWYRRDGDAGGEECVLIDPASGSRRLLLDHEKPQRSPGQGQDLFVESPDRNRRIFRRGHDLWLRQVATGEERLVLGGELYFAWGVIPEYSYVHIPLKKRGAALPPMFTGFSPSGRFVVAARIDQRNFPEYPFVEQLPPDRARPRVHLIRGLLEEDQDRAEEWEIAFVDLELGSTTAIRLGVEFVDSLMSCGIDALTWSSDEGAVYALAHAAGDKTAALLEIDVATGATRPVVTETEAAIYEPNQFQHGLPLVHVLSESGEVIWFSQRDGWGHLYLYDLHTGRCKNRITTGALVVRAVLRIDRIGRQIFFVAGCGDDGHNPYWRKVYRASLDGHGQVLLTPEAADHCVSAPFPQYSSIIFGLGTPQSSFSPSGRYFIDHMSTAEQPPHIVLRESTDGRVVMMLERTDITALLEAGFKIPQIFRVRAADGETDLWGVITLPEGIAAGERVPVIDLIYGGFQVNRQPCGFLGTEIPSRAIGMAAAYAALGMATVLLDGRGTPGRNRRFRQWTQGHGETTRGLEDHVTALKELQTKFPQLDLNRVGVMGHSWGGYYSVRAMLQFPDFFKVCVSSGGIHVPQKMPKRSWDWHVGRQHSRNAEALCGLGNTHLVERLRGKLLLLFGDLDENCSPDHTLALVDALIKAGKPFDMKLWPGFNHYQASAYTVAAVWDYFAAHL